jgi:protoporphyrinogen/coproporphyrinogen III oxidase
MVIAPRIVIVGAGISGLTVAYRLQERMPAASITVLEQAERPGGTMWTVREAGFQVEIGPNGFLDTKPTTLDLCRAVGLGPQLVEASEASGRNRYLFLGDRLNALPGGFGEFLSTDLLSWRGKLSLFWERFRKRRTDANDESIDAFARRRAGNEAAEIFADALVTGIYAGDPKLLSLPACFPRIADLEREYGSVIKGFARAAKKRRAEAKAKGVPYQRPGKMRSFAGGLRVLVETLVSQLKQAPLYGVPIRSIEKTGDPRKPLWRLHADGREAWDADAVVLTCPAHHQAKIVAELDAELAQQIRAIAYNRIAVVALGFRQADVPVSLAGFGYIAPENTKRDLLGVQWCSSIYPQRAPTGCVLLRAMCGGWQRPEIVDWPDDRLLQALLAELRLAMRITAAPIFHKIVRWDKAIPQYHLGHLERVAGIKTRLAGHPGLWLGGNAYHGVALNDCTEQGVEIAEVVRRYCLPNGKSGLPGAEPIQ